MRRGQAVATGRGAADVPEEVNPVRPARGDHQATPRDADRLRRADVARAVQAVRRRPGPALQDVDVRRERLHLAIRRLSRDAEEEDEDQACGDGVQRIRQRRANSAGPRRTTS